MTKCVSRPATPPTTSHSGHISWRLDEFPSKENQESQNVTVVGNFSPKREFDCFRITRSDAFSVRTFYYGLGMGLKPVEIQSLHKWHAKRSLLESRNRFPMSCGTA